jgi:hypothetical protein
VAVLVLTKRNHDNEFVVGVGLEVVAEWKSDWVLW